MNTKSLLMLLPLTGLCLTSCGQGKNYEDHLEDYVFAMKYHDNFNVLQLTDIHWSYNTSSSASKIYLEKLLSEVDDHIKKTQGQNAKIDLIEITGDQFMLANTYHVTTFLKFFEEKAEQYGFLYAPIWGNHDRHGLYNPNWLSRQFEKSPHCVYLELEDNLYGRSNFIINLTEDGSKEATTKWQLAHFDSGASFSETALSPFRDYDFIRDDQVRWWELEHQRAGAEVPTIAYYHIPQQDNQELWDAVHKENATHKHKFFKLEGFADNGTEKGRSKLIETGKKNHMVAAFSGHAHNNDWTVDYDGLVLGLGVKTGTELYFAHIDVNDQDAAMQEGLASVGITENFDLIGASLVTIKDGSNFDLEHVYYNERTSGDFVRWVKW